MENEEKTVQSVRDTIRDIVTEVEKHNNIKAIFGDPIREKGVVIIPVGSVASKGGGGGGGGMMPRKESREGAMSEGKSSKDWGSGLGVGYARLVKPLGFIEIKEDRAEFKPIVDAGKVAMVAIGAGIIGASMMARLWLKHKMKRSV